MKKNRNAKQIIAKNVDRKKYQKKIQTNIYADRDANKM